MAGCESISPRVGLLLNASAAPNTLKAILG